MIVLGIAYRNYYSITLLTHVFIYLLYSGVVKVPRTRTVMSPLTADTV